MIQGTSLNINETYYNMKEKDFSLNETNDKKFSIEALETSNKYPGQ